MLNRRNSLPVYSADKELLYYIHIDSVLRQVESGRLLPVGTKHRIRALIAVSGDMPHMEPSAHIPAGFRYSHCRETEDNPRGVWTFRHG